MTRTPARTEHPAINRADDGNSYRYHATGLPAGGDAIENETDNRAQSGAFPSAESPSRAVVVGRASARTTATINRDLMIYFVQVDFGGKIGRSWVERDPARMDRKSTVEDVSKGEWGNGVDVVKVMECCEEGPIFFDRTEDILREAGVFVTDDPPLSGQDKIDRRWDRRRDERKHERVL